MKKILIAGGTGFVGKQLIPFLVEKGYSIHVLTRKPSANSSKNIRFFQWEIEKIFAFFNGKSKDNTSTKKHLKE